MSLHRHLIEETELAIATIFVEKRPADKVIERTLKAHPKWGSRDRRFVAEAVYEVVRHARLLWNLSGFPDAEFFDVETWTPNRLRFMLSLHLNRKGIVDFPPWLEPVSPKREEAKLPRAVRESIPDWIDRLGLESFGDEWPELLHALNKPADVYLRANTLKSDAKKLIPLLKDEGIEAAAFGPREETLKLKERKNVFVTKAFKAGLFEVQDAASQRVAPLLQVEPGQRVVDACAGAGGKTLHLAALMKNKGRILSMDIHEWKLNELKQRARRDGVDVVETRVIEGSKTIKRLEESFDRVLLDVPCSGMGVLRRNPDSKWKLTPEEIDRLEKLQAELLASYSRMCKKGGALVYATCSVLPRENERQVGTFLASPVGEGWTLEEEIKTRPDQGDGDGFYAARLRRS